jgi:hypothetical protein
MRFPTIARDGCRRPLVPVLLESQEGNRLIVDALIDTGADVTLFPAAIAESLGIDLTNAPDRPLSSALGVIATYREHEISLELRRAPNEIHQWRTAVGFISRPMVYGILGTRGFFEFFTLTYHAADEWVQLDPSGGFPM